MRNDADTLLQLIKMMQSENDGDAIMGFRGFQALLDSKGIDFAAVMRDAAHAAPVVAVPVTQAVAAPAPVISDMPQCHPVSDGGVMFIPAGRQDGGQVVFQGAAASCGADIALHMKDALAAAVLGKSPFRLKLADIKNAAGNTVETVLRAEYSRDGLAPIVIWSHASKGEVASLATVLRRAMADHLPEFIAS